MGRAEHTKCSQAFGTTVAASLLSFQDKLPLLFKLNHSQQDFYRTVTISGISADISMCGGHVTTLEALTKP